MKKLAAEGLGQFPGAMLVQAPLDRLKTYLIAREWIQMIPIIHMLCHYLSLQFGSAGGCLDSYLPVFFDIVVSIQSCGPLDEVAKKVLNGCREVMLLMLRCIHQQWKMDSELAKSNLDSVLRHMSTDAPWEDAEAIRVSWLANLYIIFFQEIAEKDAAPIHMVVHVSSAVHSLLNSVLEHETTQDVLSASIFQLYFRSLFYLHEESIKWEWNQVMDLCRKAWKDPRMEMVILSIVFSSFSIDTFGISQTLWNGHQS